MSLAAGDRPPTIRVSAGTADLLGLRTARSEVRPSTAYLMLGGQCTRRCLFCAQAQGAQAGAGRLARITWPEFELREVLPRLGEAARRGVIRRVCAQTVAGPAGLGQLESLLGALRGPDAGELAVVPVSASVHISRPEQLRRLFGMGLERAGVALDVAGAQPYRTIRGGELAAALQALLAAAAEFPGRLSTHLIYGLGETEQELLELAARCLAGGVTVGLFAFTPVRGTPLAGRPAPALDGYRRVQAALRLLRLGLGPERMLYDQSGRLVRILMDPASLADRMADGEAFRTSGCPDCNRPYYNERPGVVPYNYPRRLAPDELEAAMAQVRPLAGEGPP